MNTNKVIERITFGSRDEDILNANESACIDCLITPDSSGIKKKRLAIIQLLSLYGIVSDNKLLKDNMLYAYAYVNGSITHRFPASISWGEVAKEIETNGRKWIDDASSDLDKDIECDLSSLSEKEVNTLFMKYGNEMMNVQGGWSLIEINQRNLRIIIEKRAGY
jgi:hypothetical protein